MAQCPNEGCPYRQKFGAPAEYREGFSTCSDCGAALVVGAPPVPASAPAPALAPSVARHRVPLSRLLITALGPAVVVALSLIPLPGLDPDFLAEFESFQGDSSARSTLLLGALGLTPFMTAFALVELFAALVPKWRPLRTSGPGGRARLAFPIAIFGTMFAVFQAFGIARWLQDIGRGAGAFDLYVPVAIADPGAMTSLLLVASLVGATLVLVFTSMLITTRGIGNGFAVVALSSAVIALIPSFESLALGVRQGLLSEGAMIATVGSIAGLVALTITLSSEPGRRKLHTGPLRAPLSGLDPAFLAAWLAPWVAQVLGEELLVSAAASFIVVVVAAVVLAFLFNAPSRVTEVLARLADAPVRRADIVASVREAFPRGVLLTIGYCAAVALSAHAVALFGSPYVFAGTTIVIATACCCDLIAELRAWRTIGELTPVWPLHQVYAGDAVVELLAREQIPVFLRGAAFRALSPFFSSFVPIEVLVPAAEAQRAFELLQSRLDELRTAAIAASPEGPAATAA